jgi:hypothetical protein
MTGVTCYEEVSNYEASDGMALYDGVVLRVSTLVTQERLTCMYNRFPNWIKKVEIYPHNQLYSSSHHVFSFMQLLNYLPFRSSLLASLLLSFSGRRVTAHTWFRICLGY